VVCARRASLLGRLSDQGNRKLPYYARCLRLDADCKSR
jgi:hypothetical protein